MEPAQVDEVVEVRRAAVCPVFDVVSMQEPALRAAGEAAAVVARLQRRRSAGGTVLVRRPTDSGRAVALQDADDAGVPGQSPGRLRVQRRTVLAGRRRLGADGVGVDVDDTW